MFFLIRFPELTQILALTTIGCNKSFAFYHTLDQSFVCITCSSRRTIYTYNITTLEEFCDINTKTVLIHNYILQGTSHAKNNC